MATDIITERWTDDTIVGWRRRLDRLSKLPRYQSLRADGITSQMAILTKVVRENGDHIHSLPPSDREQVFDITATFFEHMLTELERVLYQIDARAQAAAAVRSPQA